MMGAGTISALRKPSMPSRVYSLPPGISFVDALAAALLKRWPDPLTLTHAHIYLPNRRSARALREAFLRESNGTPLLLPRMLPLGELDADELALVSGTLLPPALPPERRQILLARLIKSHQPELPMAQALALALALGRLMDEAAEEAVDLDQLDTLVPLMELAAHWNITLDFLQPVLRGWPKILEVEGHLDNAQRRNQLLRAQAEQWRHTPPAHPVIIAGSTSVLPALVELKKTVLTLPQGEILLPGVPPLTETAPYWEHIDVSHPLAEVKELLGKLDIDLTQVRPWPLAPAPHALRRLWQTAFLPAAATPQWMERDREALHAATHSLTVALCASAEEEATVIALRLRSVLTESGRTALLVTPDRNLARRVVEICHRWNVNLVDSGGTALPRTVPAIYMRLVAHAAETGKDIDLLTLLKHPLTAAGLPLGQCRDYARAFEILSIRQSDPHPEWPMHPAQGWVNEVRQRLAPLTGLLQAPTTPFIDILKLHVEVAEALASTDTEGGAARLWRGEAGEALAENIARLLDAATALPPVQAGEYEEAFVALLQCAVVRPRYGQHPRLNVLGALEAELISADVVILGGLNEAVWPALPKPDPWLSRTMRQGIGLQAPERDIGREAHDFMQLASQPEVMLTRALRQDGAPTVPSRWLQRLQAVVDLTAAEQRGDRWIRWAHALDAAPHWTPVSRPAPCPPLDARPRQLSVTRVEMWRRDPYALYAYKILRLEKLGELEPQAEVADKGNFLHEVLEKFLKAHPQGTSGQLLDIAETVFAARNWGAAEHRLWWPRLEKMAEWFVATQAARDSKPLLIEAEGELSLTLDSGLTFTLTARVDRIDRKDHGPLVVLDYKSGTLPSRNDQELGFAPQLPLTAMIVQAGGFGQPYAQEVSDLEFWRLATADGGDIEGYKIDVKEAVEAAREGLLRLIAVFDDPACPYRARPWSQHALRYNVYGHLERIKEWSIAGAEVEE